MSYASSMRVGVWLPVASFDPATAQKRALLSAPVGGLKFPDDIVAGGAEEYRRDGSPGRAVLRVLDGRMKDRFDRRWQRKYRCFCRIVLFGDVTAALQFQISCLASYTGMLKRILARFSGCTLA